MVKSRQGEGHGGLSEGNLPCFLCWLGILDALLKALIQCDLQKFLLTDSLKTGLSLVNKWALKVRLDMSLNMGKERKPYVTEYMYRDGRGKKSCKGSFQIKLSVVLHPMTHLWILTASSKAQLLIGSGNSKALVLVSLSCLQSLNLRAKENADVMMCYATTGYLTSFL